MTLGNQTDKPEELMTLGKQADRPGQLITFAKQVDKPGQLMSSGIQALRLDDRPKQLMTLGTNDHPLPYIGQVPIHQATLL